jgi:ketosteroid isomerase-like protein
MRPLAELTLISLSVAVAGIASAAESEPTSVIEAEYAFAQSAKPLGVRGAFLKWLAPDSIICSPAPVNGVVSTAAGDPNGDTLEWYPARSQTAGSGDMGYTMGPWKYRSADGKAAAQGTFLSVWRKQPDNSWRVVLDCGVSHAKPDVAPAALGSAASSPSKPKAAMGWRQPIGTAEAQFTAAATANSKAALKSFGADDIRVMARGVPVAVGVAAGQEVLDGQKLGSVWGHAFAAQADDGTLGYAWGYIGDAQSEAPTAAYVNVWQRASVDAPWKIVAQSLQVIPPPKKN